MVAQLERKSRSSRAIIVPLSVLFLLPAATLPVTQIGAWAFSDARITSMTIPRHVQILCSRCFLACNSLSSISFETNSELTRIESNAFCNCFSLKSIIILQHVKFIHSSTFAGPSNLAISIESSNLHFVVQSDFILDSSNTKLILYFGTESNIVILYHVQILCSERFSGCNSLSSISFETNSELTRIESNAFET
jgi:hypothetical protein